MKWRRLGGSEWLQSSVPLCLLFIYNALKITQGILACTPLKNQRVEGGQAQKITVHYQ